MANITRQTPEVPARTPAEWDPFRVMRDWMNMSWGVPSWGPGLPSSYANVENRLGYVPNFDVKETKEGYVIKADLPGVKDSDVDIQFQGDKLRISGKRESEREEKTDTYYACERSFGSFSRMFSLPDGCDGDKAKAELKDGKSDRSHVVL